MAIKKVSEGLLFEDNFEKHNLIWTITPIDNTRYQYLGNGVKLKHGDGRVVMSMPSPYNYSEYAIEVEFEHTPVTLSDVGGLVFMSTTDDSIECQSYFNHLSANTNGYKFIRVLYKLDVYQFLVSKDGKVWEEAGNGKLLGSNQFGFFLDGVKEPQSSDFLAKKIKIHKTSFTDIRGINANGDVVEIKDSKGNFINNIDYLLGQGFIKLNLSQVQNPVECSIAIIDSNTNTTLFDSGLMVISSGDIYETSENIKFYINGTLLENHGFTFDLGTLTGKENFSEVSILNDSIDNVLYNKVVSISKFSPYSSGHEKVKIAIIENGVDLENLDYKEYVDIESIYPSETVRLALRIERSPRDFVPTVENTYKFKINLE